MRAIYFLMMALPALSFAACQLEDVTTKEPTPTVNVMLVEAGIDDRLGAGNGRQSFLSVDGFSVVDDGVKVDVSSEPAIIMERERRSVAPGVSYRVDVSFTPLVIEGEPHLLFLAQSLDGDGKFLPGRFFATRMRSANYLVGQKTDATMVFAMDSAKAPGSVQIASPDSAQQLGFGVEVMRNGDGSSFILHDMTVSEFK